MAQLKITDERKTWDSTRHALKSFDGVAVSVGLFEPEQASKGYRHEFGVGVPARPWMAPSSDGAVKPVGTVAEREVGKLIDGKATAPAGMLATGQRMADAMRDYIIDGKVGGDPLTDGAKRRNPRKLIHSGTMVDSLEAKIEPEES